MFLYSLWHYVAGIPGKIKFKNRDPLSQEEKDYLMRLFASGYYIILTGHKYHGSTFAVKVLTFLSTGKWTRYSHALMNVDNLERPEDALDFKFMEATETGTHYATFEEVTDCTDICILSPVNMENMQWTAIIDAILSERGRPYDDLFNMADITRFSCVELVRYALKQQGDYDQRFGHLEKMMIQYGTLTPQMFRDCPDFRVVWEN